MRSLKFLGPLWLGSCYLVAIGGAPAIAHAQEPETGVTEAAQVAEAEPSPVDEKGTEGAETEVAEESSGTPGLSSETPWPDRVGQLRRKLLLGEIERSNIDDLLQEIDPQLEAARNRLRSSLDSGASQEELADRHDQMEKIYDARELLLEEATAQYRVHALGMGARGVREGKKELDRLQLHMRFQATRAPSTAQKLLSDLRTSPIPFLKGLVSLVLALVVFRLWRRWAKQAMPAMRQKFLTARPRTRANIGLAKFFWYLDRLRTPVEWLILLMVAASIIRPTDRFQDEDPVKLVVKWVFIGWAGLRLVDALVARGGAGRSRDTSGLRLRSLKLAWGWVAGSGLAMDLTDEYVGLGTLHSWSWWVFMALGVPVLLILLVWWKKTIFERLAREPDPPQMVQRLLARSAERQRYVGAALGGVFLLGRGIQREIVRFFSNFEVGRRVQAAIFRREVERQSSRSDKPRDPLPQHLQDRLLAGHKLVPKVYRDQVRSVVTRARGEQGWAVALVGERGMGKSTFLSRVASELDEQILVVDCPLGGFDHFYEALLDRLGLAGTHRQDVEILRAALNEHGIKVIALDNAHRLAAPMIGGFVDYGRAFEMIRELGGAFSWISTFDRIAFQFIKSARAEGALTAQEIVLPKWTEEQIGELLTVRAEAAGIEPSYDQLELPRQLDEASYEAEGDRKRHGYNRVLWDTSQGNPGVALRMWCDTLGLAEDGSVEVVLRSKRTVADLDDLSLTSQFVLRCLVQMEYASLEDVIRALNLPAADVEMALHAAHARGLVEDQDGVFSIAWTWYRLITRLLTRQNLLAS